MYFWIGGCRSMQQSGLSLLLCLPFCTLFHSLSTVAFASGINNAWGERSFAHALGFPRQVSLRDRSPESSEPYVTLDSRSSLIRTTFGVHTSFFPRPHLRVSRTLQAFRDNGKICPTDTPCRETRQHGLAFTLKTRKLGEELSSDLFHQRKFVYQSCNIILNSVFLLQYPYN